MRNIIPRKSLGGCFKTPLRALIIIRGFVVFHKCPSETVISEIVQEYSLLNSIAHVKLLT